MHLNCNCMMSMSQVYVGEWKDHKKHGRGKMTFPDGKVYTGDFAFNSFAGKGILMFPDGAVYEVRRHTICFCSISACGTTTVS